MSGARLVLLLMLVAAPAHAGSVSIVVTGDLELKPQLSQELESWLRGHGHVIGDPLPTEIINTLLNCMLIDDQGCARGVVEARAKADAVLYGQIARSRTSKATIVTIYWLSKGKEPVGMRRACEDCTKDLMHSTLDEILGMVVSASGAERGRLAVHSRPEGMTVILDKENIGTTPLEREVAAGEHTIVLVRRGRKVGERTLKIQSEVTAEITIPVTIVDEPEPSSRVVPSLALGVGGATAIAGAVLFFTSEEDDGSKLYYRDTKWLGVGLAAGGLAVAGVGAYLWTRRGGSSDSRPVAAVGRGGGTIGWARAF